MFDTGEYQLLDFGDGRKLERFGEYVLDRPAPAATAAARRQPDLWQSADARFERADLAQGRWYYQRQLDTVWPLEIGPLTFELKLTDFGHVGLFPEQLACWQAIADHLRELSRPSKVLNLFAYTGGSTLAAALAGAEVVHVDSAANVVTWARRNAQASSLARAPIRWITDDVRKFVARELRRGNNYDAVILDPPAYGHGPRGEVWKLDEHLAPLVEQCLSLIRERAGWLLLTCHSGQLSVARELELYSRQLPAARNCGASLTSHDLTIASRGGDHLHSGAAAWWRLPVTAHTVASREAPT